MASCRMERSGRDDEKPGSMENRHAGSWGSLQLRYLNERGTDERTAQRRVYRDQVSFCEVLVLGARAL